MLPATAYAQIQETLAAASQVVSERLHVSLFALASSVPTTVLSYERKIDEVVGRLYPSVRITPRERFWTDPAAWSEPSDRSIRPGHRRLGLQAADRGATAPREPAPGQRVRSCSRPWPGWRCCCRPARRWLRAIWLKRIVVAARKSGARVDRHGTPVTLLEPANP